jgi:hypothetical protein
MGGSRLHSQPLSVSISNPVLQSRMDGWQPPFPSRNLLQLASGTHLLVPRMLQSRFLVKSDVASL